MARVRGNELFGARDFAAAAAAYSTGLSSIESEGRGDASEQALLLSNRAACLLELGDREGAAADCRRAIDLQPAASFKAYGRLARALPPDDPSAAAAVCAALALAPSSQPPQPQLVEQYHAIRAAADAAAAASTSSQPRALLLRLPDLPTAPGSGVLACASTSQELERAAMAPATSVVVLMPGVYNPGPMFVKGLRSKSQFTLIGLKGAELRSSYSHALYVEKAQQLVQVAGLRLAGSGQHAAVCVASSPGTALEQQARLRLFDCLVQDYGDVAVLAVGAVAELQGCSFLRTGRQAVEVREGGGLVACDCVVDGCAQGLSVYGGARTALLRGCRVLRSLKEGVLAAGSAANAATQAQGLKACRGGDNAASQQAEAWGKQQGIALQVTLLECTISHNHNFGVSADSGTSLVLSQCRLEDNDPYAVFIKGGTDALVTACQFIYSGKVSKSRWAKSAAGDAMQLKRLAGGRASPSLGALHTCAVCVAINYGGSVVVKGCAFAGPDEGPGGAGTGAVHEEMTDPRTMQEQQELKLLGLWSKPAVLSGNVQLEDAASASGFPSIGELVQRLPPQLRACGPGPGAGAVPAAPPAAALRRPTSTFQCSQWAPTAHEFYCIGNTFGFDVTGGLAPELPVEQELRVLLAACGDIRNLLATVLALSSQPAPGGGRRLSFVLNDGNASMLARDALLLHMAADPGVPAEALLDVWASHALPAAHGQLLRRSLEALAHGSWPAWLSASMSLDDAERGRGACSAGAGAAPGAAGEAELLLRRALAAWADCTMPLEKLLALRSAAVGTRTLRSASLQLSLAALSAGSGSGGGSGSVSADAERLPADVKRYIDGGSLREGEVLNPTFLLAPQLQYTVYFSSSIVRAVPLGPGGKQDTLYSRLLATLAPQLDALRAALLRGRLRILLVPGDILAAMVAPPPASGPGATFDYVDCSNVADYVSLPALLQAAAPLLEAAPHARLRCESLVAFARGAGAGAGQPAARQFVERQLGMSLAAYEALLGLRLLGGGQLAGLGDRAVRLEWAAAAAPRGASFLSSGLLLLELMAAFKLQVVPFVTAAAPPNGPGQWQSAAAPATLSHLIALAAPKGQALTLLRAVMRCDSSGKAQLFKWELEMHVMDQSGGGPPLMCVQYAALPGFRLLPYQDRPLLLAVSKGALALGQVPAASAKRLLSTFAWDEEQAVAHFLLPRSLLEQCAAEWYVTLCVLLEGCGLWAVGAAARMGALPATPLPAAAPGWRPLPAPPLLALDTGLLEGVGQAAAAGAAAASRSTSWPRRRCQPPRLPACPSRRCLVGVWSACGPRPSRRARVHPAGRMQRSSRCRCPRA